MSVIGFINLLRDYPLVGLLLGLVFFAFMFGIKTGVVYLFSKQLEKEKQHQCEKA